MNNHRKGILVYLLIAFGMAWVSWEIVIDLGVSVRSSLFQVASLPSAFAPAIAAFVVRKWVTREGFADAGLRLNLHKWPYYLVAWLLPFAVVAWIVASAGAFKLSEPDFSLMRAVKSIVPAGTALHAPPPPFAVPLVLAIVAIFGAPISFGEEFGWRGYLQPRLFPARPVLGGVVTGLIWSLWHFPVLLRGYVFPDHRVSGMFVFTVSTILMSIIFEWLVLATGSIWSSSLAHAATNAIGGSLTFLWFGGGPNFLFLHYVGILGWVPLGALTAWIVLTGRLKPRTLSTSPVQSKLGRAPEAGS